VMILQSNLYLHAKYESIEEICLYPGWEVLVKIRKGTGDEMNPFITCLAPD